MSRTVKAHTNVYTLVDVLANKTYEMLNEFYRVEQGYDRTNFARKEDVDKDKKLTAIQESYEKNEYDFYKYFDQLTVQVAMPYGALVLKVFLFSDNLQLLLKKGLSLK